MQMKSISAEKLLIVDHSGAPGGGQLGLLRYLRLGSKFERQVLLLEGGALVEELRNTGVPVTVLKGQPGKFSALLKIPALYRRIRAFNPEIILANSLRSAIALSLLPNTKACRVYYLREGLASHEISGPKRWIVIRFLLPRFNGFLANSNWTAATIPSSLNLGRPVRVAFPICGVPAAQFPQDSTASADSYEQIKIVYLGRLAPWKGVHVLLEAAAELVRRNPASNFHITVVGGSIFADASYEQELRRLAREADGRITFTGHLNDVRPYLSPGNVLAHCSIQPEPFGQVIVQAMDAGMPVLTTDHGGPKDIIAHGKTGWILPPGDANALADRLQELLENPRTIRKMGRAAKQTSVSYSDSAMTEMYENALSDIYDITSAARE
jgi:glycosyltransferase involved in cell wall biosynthesis